METNHSYNMCRLCLFRNNSLIDIFEVNAVHGFVIAEVIADILSLQVSKDDGYPRVVCERCLEKLNEFKVFKEVCYTLKATYDNLFFNRRASSQNQVVTIESPVKLEPVEEESSEPVHFHAEVFPNAEVITGDCGSEVDSHAEMLPNQVMNSDSELPESIVKLEPVDEIDIVEPKSEDLFHLSRDEISDPVRENVIFHSQVEMTPMHSEPCSDNDFEKNEGNGAGAPFLDESYKRRKETKEERKRRLNKERVQRYRARMSTEKAEELKRMDRIRHHNRLRRETAEEAELRREYQRKVFRKRIMNETEQQRRKRLAGCAHRKAENRLTAKKLKRPDCSQL